MAPLVQTCFGALKHARRFSRAVTAPRFIPPQLDGVEDVEDYRPGGLFPVVLGDTFGSGRYKVVHKLGFGGSSTVWLARDLQATNNRLVSLKALRADASQSRSSSDFPELAIPQRLRASFPPSVHVQTIHDHFYEESSNGSHLFLVSPLAGPNVLAMCDCTGRVAGSRRLRSDLAKKVAMQTATTIFHMHRAGVVHGDLTTSNILFLLSSNVHEWSDTDLYNIFGEPQIEEVRTRNGARELGAHAPSTLVAPIENARMVTASFLQESTIVADFGQAFIVASQSKSYEPRTIMNYQSPEARFEGRAGYETDVWALGCTIFEIRAGFPLFEPFLGSDKDILRQTVEVLGRLPDPWWSAFDNRAQWFEESGEPKNEAEQDRAGVFLYASKSSIRDKLREIGAQDDPPECGDDGPMMEKTRVRLTREEVESLGDLLEKMLKYRPEERISMEEVIRHPWLTS